MHNHSRPDPPAKYNFHIHYKSGKSNVEVCALSRIDWEKCNETIHMESIQAVVAAAIAGDLVNIKGVSCSKQAVEPILPIQSEPTAISKAITWSSNQSCTTCLEHGLSEVRKVVITDDSSCPTTGQLENKLKPKCMTIHDWVEAQYKDKIISEIVHLFKSKKLCCGKISTSDNNEIKQFIRQCNRLFLRKGVLYHKAEKRHPDRSTMQLVLPETFMKQALQGCHDDLAHLRIERTINLLRDHFYWPGMLNDTTKHVKHCERCLKFKALLEKASMENIDATYPMELVHMDYLTVEANRGGKDVNILVITDHFTCYAQAIITSSQTAKCTAQGLWDKFIVHYGVPEKILTDQGCNLESDLLRELCELAQVKKIRMLGYHPQTNGQCEHFNATLINILGTLPEKPKST